MSLSRRARFRGILIGVVLVVVLGVFSTVSALPGVVENSLNSIDPESFGELSDEAEELHQEIAVADMHADTLLWKRDLNEWGNRGHADIPRLQAGNVAVQVFSSVSKTPKGQNYDSNSADTDNIRLLSIAQLQPPRTWNSVLQRSLFHAQKLEDAAKDSDGNLRLIRTRGDLDTLLADRRAGDEVLGGIFSVEGLHNLEGDLENVKELRDAGMRMAGFTHFFDNEVAGSMHGTDKGGLTDFGRKVFAELERTGVIIDIAHASPEAVDDMLTLATRPIVSSHGGVQATCDENRNLSDEQIRRVADTGGVIGIGYWAAAVCAPRVSAVVDAIDHVVDVGGIETAALGSDFDGAVKTGWDASELAWITQELLERGYDEVEVGLIMGGNTIRVLTDVLPD